jgi:hypothetical protein
MYLIVPDILTDVQQLSAILPIGALLAGLILWLAGWWTHRFWVVLGLTVLGGIIGLQQAALLHTQPLLAAVGVGTAAGILALTLVRLLAFLAGGVAGLLIVNTVTPGWDQSFFAFLFGALAGWFLMRFWMMALSSMTGTLLIGYSGLALAGKWTTLDATAWCEGHRQLANILVVVAALAGFLMQLGCDWWIHRKPAGGKSAGKKAKPEKKDDKKEKQDESGGLAA